MASLDIIFYCFGLFRFNVLTFISKGAGDVGSWLNQIITQIKNTGKIVNTIKNTIFVSATGTKGIVDSIDNVSDNILENVQASTQVGNISPATPLVTSNTASTSIASTNISNTNDISQTNTLNRALNTATTQANTGDLNYQADDSFSSIQSGGSKSGWCYIGEDRGFRSCAPVGSADQCISGDIFPSHEICVNPNLRQ